MSADNWRDCPKCNSEDTLRENYEIFSEDDSIFIYYSCSCTKCKYGYKIERTEKFE